MFRHTFAHNFRAAGGAEGDLMVLGGWHARAMLDRYGASAAAERAAEAARRLLRVARQSPTATRPSHRAPLTLRPSRVFAGRAMVSEELL